MTFDAPLSAASASSYHGEAIRIEDLQLSLGAAASRVHILKGINLSLEKGKTIGIVGPSGSGKSSLLMLAAGLEQPSSGKIIIEGEEITKMNEDALARFRGKHIGIVFQSFHLISTMSALENVAVPLELAGRRDAFQRAREELEAVGLGARLNHYPGQLSGGEQQRVALARALAPEPALLVADEPTGNLDGTTGAQIIDLIFGLNKKRGTTLLLVTHDLTLAARCDRTIKIRDGLIEDAGIVAPHMLAAPLAGASQ